MIYSAQSFINISEISQSEIFIEIKKETFSFISKIIKEPSVITQERIFKNQIDLEWIIGM